MDTRKVLKSMRVTFEKTIHSILIFLGIKKAWATFERTHPDALLATPFLMKLNLGEERLLKNLNERKQFKVKMPTIWRTK